MATYGAPRVIYTPKKEIKLVQPEIKKPIEVIEDKPETVEEEIAIPTTFVKKDTSKGDVNKYVKKDKE